MGEKPLGSRLVLGPRLRTRPPFKASINRVPFLPSFSSLGFDLNYLSFLLMKSFLSSREQTSPTSTLISGSQST